jgi:hypothetical protein
VTIDEDLRDTKTLIVTVGVATKRLSMMRWRNVRKSEIKTEKLDFMTT